MADNTRLPQPATQGDLAATDEITDNGVAHGAKAQRVKVGFGADGAYADVEASTGLPVAIVGTPAVTVSGVATAAAQASAQTSLDAIKVATEAGATSAGQTTGNGTLASILSGLAALATAAAQTTAQTALDAIKAAVEGTLDVAVSSLPSVTIGAAVPAGDNNIGNVDIVSLPSLPAGSNAIGTVTVTSAPLPSDAATQTTLAAILAALPAALGQALAAACMPVVLPVAQDVVAYAGVNGAIKFRPSIVASDKQSSLAATGKLITATGAALYYYVKNSSGGAIFLQIFNSATQPSTGDRADGYTVPISNGGLSNGAFGQNTHGIPCPNGVYLVASSTQDTYTPIVSTAVLYTAIYLQG